MILTNIMKNQRQSTLLFVQKFSRTFATHGVRILKFNYGSMGESTTLWNWRIFFSKTVIHHDLGVSPLSSTFNRGTSTMSLLSLNCLIDGEDREKMMTIEVEKTENVGFLKDMIKEMRARRLAQVDAADLELWMVNDKCRVVELGAELVHVDPNSDTELSPPALKLSSFFNDVMVDDHLHIILIEPGECHCFKLRALSHSRTSSITTLS